MVSMFGNKKKSHNQPSYDELMKIAISDEFDPLLERVDDLKHLLVEDLANLQNIMSSQKGVIMGNKSLVDLVLLEKISEKKDLNLKEKSEFSRCFVPFIHNIGICLSDGYIKISLYALEGEYRFRSSEPRALFSFPENLYDYLPRILKNDQNSTPNAEDKNWAQPKI